MLKLEDTQLPLQLSNVECCPGKSCKTDVYLTENAKDGEVVYQYRRTANDDEYGPAMPLEMFRLWVSRGLPIPYYPHDFDHTLPSYPFPKGKAQVVSNDMSSAYCVDVINDANVTLWTNRQYTTLENATWMAKDIAELCKLMKSVAVLEFPVAHR